MNRRLALTLGVAVAAGAAGVGVGTWRRRSAMSEGTSLADPSASPIAADAATAIWTQHFDAPSGGAPVALASLRGRPLLLNFWATWCPPCIGEMPLLDRFYADQHAAGWQVVGLAVDNLEPVRGFLARHGVRYPIGLAGVEGVGLSRSLGNQAGALPFTIVFDHAGKVAARKLGAIEPSDLAHWTGLA